jgi:ComF family protein
MLRIRDAVTGVLDCLYPPKCGLCLQIGGPSPCGQCMEEIEKSRDARVRPGGEHLAFLAAAYVYEDRAGQAVRALKFGRRTSLAQWMAAEVAGLAKTLPRQAETIVPVPIHPSRRRQRGFNQAELLCEGFEPEQVMPEMLRRIKATTPQARLKREERAVHLVGAFRAANVEGRSVLLVDDAITTGFTVQECAKALQQAGATWVAAIAFAGELD